MSKLKYNFKKPYLGDPSLIPRGNNQLSQRMLLSIKEVYTKRLRILLLKRWDHLQSTS
jgi:hypothetical protein